MLKHFALILAIIIPALSIADEPVASWYHPNAIGVVLAGPGYADVCYHPAPHNPTAGWQCYVAQLSGPDAPVTVQFDWPSAVKVIAYADETIDGPSSRWAWAIEPCDAVDGLVESAVAHQDEGVASMVLLGDEGGGDSEPGGEACCCQDSLVAMQPGA